MRALPSVSAVAYALREIVQYSMTAKMHTRACSSCTRHETFSSLGYRCTRNIAYASRTRVYRKFCLFARAGRAFFSLPRLESLTLRRNPCFSVRSYISFGVVDIITEYPRDAKCENKHVRNKLLDIELSIFKIFTAVVEMKQQI